MAAFIWLLRIAVILAVSGGVLYGTWRGVSALQRHFELDDGGAMPPPLPAADGPLDKARVMAERLYETLSHHPEEGIYQDFRREIEALIGERLPTIVTHNDRLQTYLARKDLRLLEAEVVDWTHKVSSCKDADLKRTLERNLQLAKESVEGCKRMTVLQQKTQAQVHQVLLGLRNLEDKIVSLDLAGGGERELSGSLEGLLEDVNNLEEEYKQLEML